MRIPLGTFSVGYSASSQYACSAAENPVRTVTLTNALYLGRFEVTQSRWTARIGSNPSYFWSASVQVPAPQVANHPVERVSWDVVQFFGLEAGLRLPTEAEWEYAYRVGTTTAFHDYADRPNGTSDDGLVGNIPWLSSNSSSQTRPVGQKQANGFGLHDMSGNVWKWFNDWWSGAYDTSGPSVDPTGQSSGTFRVVRGGSWTDLPRFLRASTRFEYAPSSSTINLGFRVARTPEPRLHLELPALHRSPRLQPRARVRTP